jgi:hypothetical protein
LTDDNGCPYIATLTINEYDATDDIVTEVTVCEGADYTWLQNGVTYTVADSPVVLNLTDANGCPYIATLTINEYDATDDIVTEVTVCEGADYTWSQNGVTYTVADSPVVLNLTDANGCPYIATLTINEYDATDDIVTEVTVCEGADYTWSQNGVTYTVADSPVVLNLTDANGCPYIATLTINEYDATDDIVTEVTVCEGADYTWSQNGVTYTVADSPVVLNLTDANGCPYIATLTINEYDPADIDAGDDTGICIGDEVTLTATGDGSFEWSTGEMTSSITVSPQVTTTYTVKVTTAIGCEAEDSVTVTVDEKVTIGDYVFDDVNNNGIQDDGNTGVNGVTVMLYNCSNGENSNGTLVGTTVTTNNPVTGERGYYGFEVCPNSGPYYLVFENIPDGFEFTMSNIGDDALDSDVNSIGVTECFEVGDIDETTKDAGIYKKIQIFLGNKILPRDPNGFYETRPSDSACLGDDLWLWIYRDSQLGDYNNVGAGLQGFTFTWNYPNGETYTTTDNNCTDCLEEAYAGKENLNNLGLNEDDFGLYTIEWVSPDGDTGILEFTLNFPDEGCNSDGTRNSSFNTITSIFPVPAPSGSTLTIVINSINGSIEDTSDFNAVNFSAVLPANKENIGVSLFDTNGRMVNPVKTYDIGKGRDVIEYPLEYLSAGVYILKIDGEDWSDSKQVIIK